MSTFLVVLWDGGVVTVQAGYYHVARGKRDIAPAGTLTFWTPQGRGTLEVARFQPDTWRAVGDTALLGAMPGRTSQ